MLVYLREAHPADGWSVKGWSMVKDPTSFTERSKVAARCCSELNFDFTSVVDAMDDRTAIAWAAWPERIFVVDEDGKVAYAGNQGPYGFWPTDKLKSRNPRKDLKGLSLEKFLEKFLDPGPVSQRSRL